MVRRLAIIAAVLAGLGTLADRGTSSLAASTVASSIQNSEHLKEKPGVAFGGFPFLSQAFGGEYKRVELDVHDYQKAEVHIRRIQVRLEGVHLSLHDALFGADQIPVDHGEAKVTLAYADVNQFLSQKVKGVLVAGGTTGLLHVRGTVPVTGFGDVPVEGEAKLTIAGTTVHFAATNVHSVSGVPIPTSLGNFAASRLSFDLPVGGLPFGIVLKDIKVNKDDLAITAEADHFVIRKPPAKPAA